MNPALRVTIRLSALIAALMAASSLAGLFIDGLYQDPAEVAAMLRAYDLVTLAVAVPLLLAVLAGALQGSPRAQLLWLSMLGYGVYTYAIYVFGTAFNDLFLLHVALFALCTTTFAVSLANLDIAATTASFAPGRRLRVVAVLLAILALFLGGMWVFHALRFAINGTAPDESLLILPIESIHLAYTLDLALLVPGYALAALLLWKARPWGFVLGVVMSAFSVLYQLNYMTALWFQSRADVPGATEWDPMEPPIVAAFVVATILLLKRDRRAPQR